MSTKLNYLMELVDRKAEAVDPAPPNPAPTGDSNIEPPIPGVAMQGGAECEEKSVDQVDGVGRDATALDALNSHIAAGAKGTYAKAPTMSEIQKGHDARAGRATLRGDPKPTHRQRSATARSRQRSRAKTATREFKAKKSKPKPKLSRIGTNKAMKTEMLNSY